jgi:hypothetical protein
VSRAEAQGRRVGKRAALLWSLRLRVSAREGLGFRIVELNMVIPPQSVRLPDCSFLLGVLGVLAREQVLVGAAEPALSEVERAAPGHSRDSLFPKQDKHLFLTQSHEGRKLLPQRSSW